MMLHDINALLKHIESLEKKLEDLEQHHQQCFIHQKLSTSPTQYENETSSTPKHPSELTCIPFIPGPSTSQQAKSIPKWRKTAAQLVNEVPHADQWVVRRKGLNLLTVEENYFAIVAISGGIQRSISQCHIPTKPDLDPIDLAKAYARMTKGSEGSAAFTYRLHSFHELVFVSLCAVLETSGYPVEDINETMRIYVSDSEDLNLKRLRRGALWANSAICELAKAGWGDRATELFLLCGCSIAKYAAFAENRTKSLAFFVDHLKQSRYLSENFSDAQLLSAQGCKRIAYSIPAFIKLWFGHWLKISQICQYLGYGDECDSESITKLCRQYHTLRNYATAATKKATRKRKADASQSSSQRAKVVRSCEVDCVGEPRERFIPTEAQTTYGDRPTECHSWNQQIASDSRPQVQIDDPMRFQTPARSHQSSSSIMNQAASEGESSTETAWHGTIGLVPTLGHVEHFGHHKTGNIYYDNSSVSVPPAERISSPSTWTEFPPDPFQEHIDPFTVFQDLHELFPELIDASGCS